MFIVEIRAASPNYPPYQAVTTAAGAVAKQAFPNREEAHYFVDEAFKNGYFTVFSSGFSIGNILYLPVAAVSTLVIRDVG